MKLVEETMVQPTEKHHGAIGNVSVAVQLDEERRAQRVRGDR